MFYHSSWPKEALRTLLNITTGEETRRPDHFSCHSDGQGHMKAGAEILGGVWQFHDNSFLSKDPSSISPILIHSIKTNNDLYNLPLMSDVAPKSYQLVQQLVVLPKPLNFSISIFVIPASLSTYDALSSMYVDFELADQSISRLDFSCLCTDVFQPGRIKIDAWPDWDVIFVLSDLTMPIPPEMEPKDHFAIVTIPDSPKCFQKLLAQRIGRVEFIDNTQQKH
jgi:hypothetical protein